ncbi:MAG: ASCH domain-containing protein [Clostridiaceae bacterium]|nr:ASCH domain-containing protein [Clostridiaceae bacterium]
MLVLPIKKKWFDMICSGEKKEEYRDIKPYYQARFQNHLYPEGDKDMIDIFFRNGYGKSAPSIRCLCALRKGTGKEEWGAEKGKEYYILEIKKIVERIGMKG